MRHGSYRFVAGFLAIPVALYLIFVIVPVGQAFFYSLTNWTGDSGKFDFIGLKNFKTLVRDVTFRTALGHNLSLLILVPVIVIFLALLFAYLLKVGVRGNRFYKPVFFLPQVLSVPVVAVIWSEVFASTRNGLANPKVALYCVMWVLIWGSVGFYLVMFDAAVSRIPKDIFDAATIDGATPSTAFFRITLPLLRDTIRIAWAYLAILALDVYALVAVMTAGPGGPENATQVVPLQIADLGFKFGRSGYASAMGVVLFLLTLVVAAVMLRATRRERIEY
ncbi:sugar ABC transporter permease [Kribbella sp. NBC_01505]|uniref:carbohydrate ABC transporter permease n=1 Tax=Kribbella sp. NBC_01505 TaxID=2903580 RepID=UPI00386D0559